MDSLDEKKRKQLEKIRDDICADLLKLCEDIKIERDRHNESHLTMEILDHVSKLWDQRHNQPKLNDFSNSKKRYEDLIQSFINTKSQKKLTEILLQINLFYQQRDAIAAISDNTNLTLFINYMFPLIYSRKMIDQFTKIGLLIETSVYPDWNRAPVDMNIFIRFSTISGKLDFKTYELIPYIDNDKMIPVRLEAFDKTKDYNYRMERKRRIIINLESPDFEEYLVKKSEFQRDEGYQLTLPS